MAAEVSIPTERIEQSILLIRGHKVMLDENPAGLYEVETKNLVKAVKRNIERFPPHFMFQLTFQEFTRLRFQFGTSKGRGGRRTPQRKKYDAQFKVVFDAIRELMKPPEPKRHRIGFHQEEEKQS